MFRATEQNRISAEYALLNLEVSGIYFGTEKFTFTHGVGFLIGSGTEALERMRDEVFAVAAEFAVIFCGGNIRLFTFLHLPKQGGKTVGGFVDCRRFFVGIGQTPVCTAEGTDQTEFLYTPVFHDLFFFGKGFFTALRTNF